MSDQKQGHMQNINTLRSNFEKLTYPEQSIVLIISLVNFSMTRTILLKCLVKLDVRTPKGTRFQGHTLNQVLSRLISLNLISNANYPTPNNDFADYALQIASELNILEPIAEMLENMEKEGYCLTDKKLHEMAKKLRRLRLAYFRKDYDTLEQLFSQAKRTLTQDYMIKHGLETFIHNVSQKPFKGDLPDSIKIYYCHKKLLDSIITLEPCHKDFEVFQSIYNKSKEFSQEDKLILGLHYLYRGQFDEASALVSQPNNYEDLFLKGWLAYILGNGDECLGCFKIALNNENIFHNRVINVAIFYCLAELLRQDSSDSFDQIHNLKRFVNGIQKEDWFSDAFKIFEKAIRSRLEPSYHPSFNNLHTHYNYMPGINREQYPAMIKLFNALGNAWFKGDSYGHLNYYDVFEKADPDP